MNSLLIGGTGTVGNATAHALRERGETVRVMTRSAEKADDLPDGIDGVVADMEQPDSLPPAFEDIDAVFLITPFTHNETQQGLAAVEAAKKAGVDKIVYLSVAMPPGSTHIPHFKSKIPVEDAVRRSGRAWVILRPNSFYQNDWFVKDAIVQYGVYPQPLGEAGVNGIDVRDIAEAAARALTQSDYDGTVIPLHGPEALTGPDRARLYSDHLGRTVRYGGDDLDAWAGQARTMMPGWMVDDMVVMYAYFQSHGLRPAPDEAAYLRKVLGREPRSFEAFVAEHVPMWTA